jgi:hypothetical protein
MDVIFFPVHCLADPGYWFLDGLGLPSVGMGLDIQYQVSLPKIELFKPTLINSQTDEYNVEIVNCCLKRLMP